MHTAAMKSIFECKLSKIRCRETQEAPMTTTEYRRPNQSRLQRAGDATVRALLRSPLHRPLSNRLLIVTVVGRKTGREYAVPVGYVQHDGRLLIGTAAGWRRNLRPDTPVRVRLRGRDVWADAEVVRDLERALPLYRVILRHNPVHGRFVGIGVDGEGNADENDLRRALTERDAAVVALTPRA
jgi:deazaflavin-dependent oxidoreductase (nitroreductase family)